MTERAFVPLPSTVEDTPLGRLRIITRGGASAYASEIPEPRPIRTLGAMTLGAERDETGQPIGPTDATINGARYSLRVELADYGDGWQLARDEHGRTWHAIDGTRADWIERGLSYDRSKLTEAARRKVADVLVPWLIEWAAAHPDALAAGVRASREQAARSLEEKIESAERDIASLREQLAAVLAEE